MRGWIAVLAVAAAALLGFLLASERDDAPAPVAFAPPPPAVTAAVHGRVTGPSGGVWAARVVVRSDGIAVHETTTDTEGAYACPVPAGRYDVRVEPGPYRDGPALVAYDVAAGDRCDFELPPSPLALTGTAGNGREHDGLRVVAVPAALLDDGPVHPGRLGNVRRIVRRVENGRFRFEDLDPGEYRLLLDDDWMLPQPVFARVPGEPVRLEPRQAASFLVVVMDARTGARLDDARAELFRDGVSLSGAVAGEGGVVWFRAPCAPPRPPLRAQRSLSFVELEKRPFDRLAVTAPGYATKEIEKPRRAQRVHLQPAGTLRLHVQVRDAAHAPFTGDLAVRATGGGRTLTPPVPQDEPGAFRCELPPGAWAVEVGVSSPFAIAAHVAVDGEAGETRDLDLALPATGTAHFDAAHAGSILVELTYLDFDADAPQDALAPRKGGHVVSMEDRLHLDHLPAGRYAIVVMADGHRGWEDSFTVVGGRDARVAIPALRPRPTGD